MVLMRKALTTGESDPENAPGHAVAFRVAVSFVIDPPLGNRIKHSIYVGFPCGKQDAEVKISLPSLTSFCQAQKAKSL
jgi:hypothetical protein